MGIRSLNKVINQFAPCAKTSQSLSVFRGKTFAIDTFVYLYQFAYGNKNPLDGIFFMINKFRKHGITPIFVFDGKAPAEKSATIQKRKAEQHVLQTKIQLLKTQQSSFSTLATEEEINALEAKLVVIDRSMLDKVKRVMELSGTSWVQAPSEAEMYCAKLCKTGLVYGVVSEDMDTLACGASRLIRQFSNHRDIVEVNVLPDMLNQMGISFSTFQDLCILLGSDYLPRPIGYSTESIYHILKEYESIDTAIIHGPLRLHPNVFTYERIREIFSLKTLFIDFQDLSNSIQRATCYPYELIEYMKEHSCLQNDQIRERAYRMKQS